MDDVVLIITVQAAAGRRAELIAAFGEILSGTTGFEGNQSVEILKSDDDPDQLVLVEHWASLDHYGAYKAWRAASGTSVLATDLVAGPPTTVVTRPI